MDNAMKANPAAALYIRVSSEEQVKGFSLEAQREELLRYCTLHAIPVYKLYADEGISGKSITGRPALQDLLHHAKQGAFGQVVFLRMNRLSRNLQDFLQMAELFQSLGIRMHSLTEEMPPDTPIGTFLLQMRGAAAQFEREQTAENVRLGLRQRSKQGKWNCGNLVLGYRWETSGTGSNNARAEIVPAEALVVGQVFEWYAAGLGFKAITNRLNKSGIRTKKGRLFSVNGVRNILRNVNYIGQIKYRTQEPGKSKGKLTEHVVAGEHPPIISDKLWSQVQLQLKKRSKPSAKKTERVYLLPGLLKCPSCGSGMIPIHSKRQRQSGALLFRHYYVCGRYHNRGAAACKANHVPADEIERWVVLQIERLVSGEEITSQLCSAIRGKNTQQNRSDLLRELSELEKELKTLRRRKTRCFELFEEDYLSKEDLQEKLHSLDAASEPLILRKVELERQTSSIRSDGPNLEEVRTALSRFGSIFRQAMPEQQKQLLKTIIEKIVVPADRQIKNSTLYGTAAIANLNVAGIPEKGSESAWKTQPA
ncbi:resolvase [Saccharibacillus kuerlensis]|uniref:Resolvase n=2 Tax=Saccharibacillus kuerlensis TaxID=459527 RepID=A0ABQ2KVX4_9BACL|nr:resolvase [Saccharibacillus kuerlensis]